MQLDLISGKAEFTPPPKGLYKPFSIINRTTDEWRSRSRYLRQWCDEIKGRDNALTGNMYRLSSVLDEKWSGNSTGTSIFDPCLAEYFYTLFNAKSVLDPFCGGAVRGVVAALNGIDYTGYDVRLEQIESNVSHLSKHDLQAQYIHSCLSQSVSTRTYDMVFSCPPYGDMEVYSKQPDDISNMDWNGYTSMMRTILIKAYSLLNTGGHMAMVVGNYRRNGQNIDIEHLVK